MLWGRVLSFQNHSEVSPVAQTHQGLQLGTVDGELDESAVGNLERNTVSVASAPGLNTQSWILLSLGLRPKRKVKPHSSALGLTLSIPREAHCCLALLLVPEGT